MSDQRVILITGASSGAGQSTARLLSQRGYRVFGTSRNPAVAEHIPGVEMLALDVRADDSVGACLDAVTRMAGRLGQPALRALAGAGYTRLEQLTRAHEADLLQLHGFGPNALRLLAAPLASRGKSFAPARRD